MGSWRHNGAKVVTEARGKSGLVEANYSGLMTPGAFDALRTEALHATQDATVFVVRFDHALILMGDEPPLQESSYSKRVAPGALIVRPDQYELWSNYARKLGEYGVIRTVWTEANARLAYEWALRRAAHSRIEELQH